MTEAEWLACTDPWLLEEALGARVTYRRRLLIAAAGLRRVAGRIPHADPDGLLARVERLADGGLTADEFGSGGGDLLACRDDPVGALLGAFLLPPHGFRAAFVLAEIPRLVAGPAAAYGSGDHARELAEQLGLFRDVVGNPFRPARFDPDWRTSTALALARGIYAEGAFDRLPILADALEDAGCESVEVLGHCRSEGPHVRGCWVVDLVLGKA